MVWRSVEGSRSVLGIQRLRQLVLLGMTVVAVLMAASPARAEPPGAGALPVTVVAVKSDDALDQAEALTGALRKAVRDSQGWSLEEGKTHSLEFLILQMKCSEPIDASCEARIADVIKTDRYLWSVISLSGDFVAGTINFWVRGKGTSRAKVKYSANLSDPMDDALIAVATNAFGEVAGGAPEGSVKVSTGGIEGQLYVDDEPVGALGAEGGTFQLPSGDHRIVVKAPGYADAESTVTVQPASTIDVQLTMVEVEEESSVDGRMIGGFISLGVGVAAGAVGLWAALDVNTMQDDDQYQAYREDLSESASACDAAEEGQSHGGIASQPIQDICNSATTREIIQAVMFPVAAVAAGVGGFLLGTSSLGGDGGADEPAARLLIQPQVGPDTQRLQVIYRF